MFDVHYILPLHIIGEKNYTIIALFVSTLVLMGTFENKLHSLIEDNLHSVQIFMKQKNALYYVIEHNLLDKLV